MCSWTWAGASCIGVSHSNTNTRLQDAHSTKLFRDGGRVFGSVVSDGAGSADYGGQGASIVCRTISSALRDYLKSNSDIPPAGLILDWVDLVRDRINAIAERRDLLARDFAATMVFVVSDGSSSLFAHIGDGGTAIQEAATQKWITPTWPNQGEYASTTFFITDDAAPPIRICQTEFDISAVAIFSDGLERLALNFSEQEPHEPFFDAMIRPLEKSDSIGRDRRLCDDLLRFLDSDRVNKRTDDDKTLVLAARK